MYGAFVDAAAVNVQTAIHVAAFVGHTDIIEVKSVASGDKHLTDHHSSDPLQSRR